VLVGSERCAPPLDGAGSVVNTVHVAAENPDTRARLLEHARDLYLAGGPEGFSLREVARRSGVSAPAVYRHFSGKDALLGAVCEEGFRLFSSYLLRALREATPLERLRTAADLYRRFALENPRDYRVIFMTEAEPRAVAGRDRPPLGGGDPTFQFLVDRVHECMQAKVLARGDATETAAVIWAHVHGLASLRLCGHLDPAGDDAEFARFFLASTDRLLGGLAP
jgi:AcrR family transcriptional regulator